MSDLDPEAFQTVEQKEKPKRKLKRGELAHPFDPQKAVDGDDEKYFIDKSGHRRTRTISPATGELKTPGTFEKGADPRRTTTAYSKAGRITNFSRTRKIAQQIASESVDGESEETNLESILRSWMTSKNPLLQKAFVELAFGKTPDRPADDDEDARNHLPHLPADLIAPQFLEIYRLLKHSLNTEYVLCGGRGSTKSSFISLAIIWLMMQHPHTHAVVARKLANTMRDSVFSQMQWAIDQLGQESKWVARISPMELEFMPTGQKIYFRGADDPGKLKSLKPPFGSIGILWLEELDQFPGPEAIRKIEQSVIRGGEFAYVFKSFNPPRTANNWANTYVLQPKKSMVVHRSDYRTVPREWLGEPWINEANHLAMINPEAYNHEYLGIANASGGAVFNNITIREIKDSEIETFNTVLHGLDFGFYPDPAHYTQVAYNPTSSTLYIFGEVQKYKHSNQMMYDAIKEYGYEDGELLICDSAEPKSVADFREYGATARGAEKGKQSVEYSIKWLQSIREIVIDPIRCPATADEFINYEYERTKDDELISAYPDKNNHSIDAVRYATNLIWKRRGQ